MKRRLAAFLVAACIMLVACSPSPVSHSQSAAESMPAPAARVRFSDDATARAHKLAAAAQTFVGKITVYDPSYVGIAYPGGDVPADRGACADLVVRAFRKLGIDLQVRVHEDMLAHFAAYSHTWGLSRPDPNIDHRRVPNLARYFTREGTSLPVTRVGKDYWPGDVVTWDLGSGGHIGIVSAVPAEDGSRYCVVDMDGPHVFVEDKLFAWKLTGHFRPL